VSGDLRTQHAEFVRAGYDVIPLRPRARIPLRSGWGKRPTFVQWRNAPADANLGLRAGQGRAFLDCDDKNKPGTSDAIFNWLQGLGHPREELPIVQTPSGIGHHVYVSFASWAELFDSRKNFTTSFGAGDFRYGPGSYVGTFPDVIEGVGQYQLLQGDITRLPVLDLRDVAQLVDINSVSQGTEAKRGKPSRLALAIMAGNPHEKYQGDASRAEMALVQSLVNSGYDLEAIRQIFDEYPCAGHYRALKSAAYRSQYLSITYNSALARKDQDSPTRQTIAALMEAVRAGQWGRATDRLILLAHLQIAHRAGRPSYAAALRDLAPEAGVALVTASNATKRLLDAEYLTIAEQGTRVSATTYTLRPEKIPAAQPLEAGAQRYANHDAFRNGGGRYAKGRLGRRAGQIYELLMAEPLTMRQIEERTGASHKTVKLALRKMNRLIDYKTGEVIEMVSCSQAEGGLWRGNLVDLDLVAAITQTYGATGRQRAEYDRERREHLRSLELATIAEAK
jgi:hypothetical protein